MVLLYQFLLLQRDRMQRSYHLLLKLQIYLQFYVLQLEDVILDDNLQKISILFSSNTPVHLLPDLTSSL